MGKASQPTENSATGAGSVVRVMGMGRRGEPEGDGNPVHPDGIGRTAKQQPVRSGVANLGDVAPFDNHGWEATPYQPGAGAATSTDDNASVPTDVTSAKSERDAMDKASLGFVRNNNSASTQTARTAPPLSIGDLGIGLSPGTKLRARLESAVNTAGQTPVVAVIE